MGQPQRRRWNPFQPEKLALLTELPYSTLFSIWIGMGLLFGVAYFLLTFLPGQGPTTDTIQDLNLRFWNCVYFSVITATSTGFGDFVPQGFSKVLASIQSMSTLIVFAVFVSKLISHRQEMALQEVHRLSYEDVFHNIREDLYVIRKDLDQFIHHAKRKHSLTEKHWQDLATAYEQAQMLLREIPEFYNGGSKLYTIDALRERLLLEALHRTLHRINALLEMLTMQKIDWVSEEHSMDALRELLDVIDETVSDWRKRSPYDHDEAFEDLLHTRDSISTRIADAMPVREMLS